MVAPCATRTVRVLLSVASMSMSTKVRDVPPRRIAPTPAEQVANVGAILSAHAALAAFFAVAVAVPGARGLWLLAPLACVLHQKALSEWMHEGAHWNVLADRAWNDRVVQWLACAAMFEDIDSHRKNHFRHHARREGFFAPGDPDTELLAVRTRRDLVLGFVEDLVGITALRTLRAPREGGGGGRAPLLAGLAYVAAGAALAVLGPPLAWAAVPVYLLSLALLYPIFNRVRVYTQHVELAADGTVVVGSETSRTVLVRRAAFLDHALVASRVMVFHAEHHRYPALPFRQLEAICAPSDDPNRYYESRLGLLRRIYRGLPARAPAPPGRRAEA